MAFNNRQDSFENILKMLVGFAIIFVTISLIAFLYSVTRGFIPFELQMVVVGVVILGMSYIAIVIYRGI